jgi:hypothetical protein
MGFFFLVSVFFVIDCKFKVLHEVLPEPPLVASDAASADVAD